MFKRLSDFISSSVFIKLFLIVGIGFNLFAMSLFVLHGDVNFISDVARDFLLFQEIDVKKLILIGPRSSTNGIFHGPLWLYFNYPAYLLGGGNPIVVSWFWLLSAFGFLALGFFVAKKLFGTLAGWFYVLLLSGNMIFLTSSMFNPHGALFLLPLFFFTILLYLQTQKWWFLAAHIFLAGLIIQFQMAVGIPLMVLSGIFILYFTIKTHHLKHLFLLLLLIPMLGNFFIFEYRHDFNMTKAVLNYSSPKTESGEIFDYHYMFFDRIGTLLDPKFGIGMTAPLTGFVFALVLVLTYFAIRSNPKSKPTYFLLLFYYFGYVALTFINKGAVLDHQFFPILALSTLWLASLVTVKQRILYISVIVLIFLFNFQYARNYMADKQENFFTKNIESWQFLKTIPKLIAEREGDREFGYFVYSPDAFAYQPRYAFLYNFKNLNSQAREYSKLPTTYVIAAPDPSKNPYTSRENWIKDKLLIGSKPVWVKSLPNGYQLEEYHLTESELGSSFDQNIMLGIHFR